MPRWTEQEEKSLAEVRSKLHSLLAARPQYPEVVGDRKLLRFIRGHNFDIEKATEMIEKYLNWRTANNIDAIR